MSASRLHQPELGSNREKWWLAWVPESPVQGGERPRQSLWDQGGSRPRHWEADKIWVARSTHWVKGEMGKEEYLYLFRV